MRAAGWGDGREGVFPETDEGHGDAGNNGPVAIGGLLMVFHRSSLGLSTDGPTTPICRQGAGGKRRVIGTLEEAFLRFSVKRGPFEAPIGALEDEERRAFIGTVGRLIRGEKGAAKGTRMRGW